MLHGSSSGAPGHRKCLCARLPSSLPQSAQRGDIALAARNFRCCVHCPSTTTERRQAFSGMLSFGLCSAAYKEAKHSSTVEGLVALV